MVVKWSCEEVSFKIKYRLFVCDMRYALENSFMNIDGQPLADTRVTFRTSYIKNSEPSNENLVSYCTNIRSKNKCLHEYKLLLHIKCCSISGQVKRGSLGRQKLLCCYVEK